MPTQSSSASTLPSEFRASGGSPPRLLTSNQVCEILGISLKTLQRLRRKKSIPYIIFGKTVRYRPVAVERFVSAREVVAA